MQKNSDQTSTVLQVVYGDIEACARRHRKDFRGRKNMRWMETFFSAMLGAFFGVNVAIYMLTKIFKI